jgi:hypothetical protein
VQKQRKVKLSVSVSKRKVYARSVPWKWRLALQIRFTPLSTRYGLCFKQKEQQAL